MPAGGKAQLWANAPEQAVYLLQGAAKVDGTSAHLGQLLVRGVGGALALEAGADGADLLVLGGPPLDGPIVRYGPFVGGSEAELVDFIRAYNAGRFGRIAHH